MKNKKIIFGIIILIILLLANSTTHAKNPYSYNYGDVYGINAFSENLISENNRIISYMDYGGYPIPIQAVHDDIRNNTCYLYGINGISCVRD